MNIFVINVKKELEEQGKKQKDLAIILNVNKTTISAWLRGQNDIPINAIPQIAKFLDVSTDYLFGLEN